MKDVTFVPYLPQRDFSGPTFTISNGRLIFSHESKSNESATIDEPEPVLKQSGDEGFQIKHAPRIALLGYNMPKEAFEDRRRIDNCNLLPERMCLKENCVVEFTRSREYQEIIIYASLAYELIPVGSDDKTTVNGYSTSSHKLKPNESADIGEDLLSQPKNRPKGYSITQLRSSVNSKGILRPLAFLQMMVPALASEGVVDLMMKRDTMWPSSEKPSTLVVCIILILVNICTRIWPRQFKNSVMAWFLLSFSTLAMWCVIPDIIASKTLLLWYHSQLILHNRVPY